MNDVEPFEKTVTHLLRKLVNEFIFHPEDLEITPRRFQKIISITWRGHRGDTSRMIGTGGATYEQLAKLMAMVGQAHGYEVDLERVSPAIRGVAERYDPFKARPDWPRARIMDLLEEMARMATKHGQVRIESGDLTDSKTGVQVDICTAETLNTETRLRETLAHVFNVIGNKNGRTITLNVTRALPLEVQPETAAGRFAPVKPR